MKEQLIPLLPMIRRYAFSLTGNVHDADDLLQNTVERVLTKSAPDDVDLTKWVFRVCRNIWIDDYRSRKVRRLAARSPELSDERYIDGEKNNCNHISLLEVNAAMDHLADEQRCILSLVAVQGMSYQEVSDTLSIPIGTVMSRVARARMALVSCLNRPSHRTAT